MQQEGFSFLSSKTIMLLVIISLGGRHTYTFVGTHTHSRVCVRVHIQTHTCIPKKPGKCWPLAGTYVAVV